MADVGLLALAKEYVDKQMASIFDRVYPVNSIYISYSHIDPSTLFGGTWERIQEAFLWGCTAASDIGQVGGEKTVTLTETMNGKHTHTMYLASDEQQDSYVNAINPSAITWTNKYTKMGAVISLDPQPSSNRHNNLPPYIQVSIWRRTA